MKKHWKLAALAVLLVFALAACSGESGGRGSAAAEVRDLGGITIVIGNWWSDASTATIEPTTAAERRRWEDRAMLEELHNFTIVERRMGDWGQVRDMLPLEISAGNREVQIWQMEPSWFASMHGQNFFAPIPLNNFNQIAGVNWNRNVINETTRNNAAYAFAVGDLSAGGVFFNMRLFEEAGLPGDLPFTLQAEGRWTWEEFTNVARRLSRDTNNDGIIDTWAITAFHSDMIDRAMASNGANYVGRDANGHFTNTTNTPQFLEVISWMVQLREEMLAAHENDFGGQWNYFIDAFNSGQGAMRIAAVGEATTINNNLRDPWGFVAFPRGPSGRPGHYSWVGTNFMAIPSYYTAEEVDAFMFAFNLWNRPLAEDDPDDWKYSEYARHYDPRSVDETMVNWTRNPNYHIISPSALVAGGIDQGPNWGWRVWVANLGGSHPTAATIVEEASPRLDNRLAEANAIMFPAP